jgi:hypothetical protein
VESDCCIGGSSRCRWLPYSKEAGPPDALGAAMSGHVCPTGRGWRPLSTLTVREVDASGRPMELVYARVWAALPSIHVDQAARCGGGSADPAALARFWSALLQQPITQRSADEGRVALHERVNLVFVVGRHPKHGTNRLHLDLASTSAAHQAALVEWARKLGAAAVDIGQGAVPRVVLADPEGYEFCVLEPARSTSPSVRWRPW